MIKVEKDAVWLKGDTLTIAKEFGILMYTVATNGVFFDKGEAYSFIKECLFTINDSKCVATKVSEEYLEGFLNAFLGCFDNEDKK